MEKGKHIKNTRFQKPSFSLTNSSLNNSHYSKQPAPLLNLNGKRKTYQQHQIPETSSESKGKVQGCTVFKFNMKPNRKKDTLVNQPWDG